MSTKPTKGRPRKRGGVQTPPTAEAEPSDLATELTPIVAIGTSAGGFTALKRFFSQVPETTGVAFVVVIHLSPDYESHLEPLLQPHVKIPVQQITQTVKIEQDRVYVIPPNANLDAIDTHLRLSQLEAQRQQRAPIDHFFRTLADTHGSKAIGVILTGTGSDGTLGLRRIKERGGLTVVQDPTEAEFDGMPQSAITSAPVDLVLPLEKIPTAVLRFAGTRPQLHVLDEGENIGRETQELLQKVYSMIHMRTGRDFSDYKQSTMLRRIARRMQFNHVTQPKAYLDLLRRQPGEVTALADDLLITVSSFFRDPAVFDSLARNVIPKLFVNKGPADSVRAWTAGCATGEEAYSIAILLLEEASRHESPPSIQVFASDLHQPSLEMAREGFYPADIETDVSPERIEKFFQPEHGGYRVRKPVRDAVLFTPHNILADPPFSRLELASCRNLLIYLRRDLQRRVIELFHYALKPGGFLILGSSESADAGDLFSMEDKKHCLYRKLNVPVPEPRLPVFPVLRGRPSAGVDDGGKPTVEREPLGYAVLHQRLLSQHRPPSVLLSPNDKVVHYAANAGRFFVQPGGEPTTNVYKLVREELRMELRGVLQTARAKMAPVRSKALHVRFNGEPTQVVIDAQPAVTPEHEGFVLILFEEQSAQAGLPIPRRGRGAAAGPNEARLAELDAERQALEQRMQAVIEEFETSQEETRAANEELQSTNEELRSTLEELETSKEELQSMNEELQTVNQENRNKVEELAQLSNDLQNLLIATDIGTLFLDRDLRILRFTPKTTELFNVRGSDRGRPLTDLTASLQYDGFAADARKVLDRLVPIEREVQDRVGRWFLMRSLPYRTAEDRIAGVVMTFVDITRQKQAEAEIRAAKETAERIIEALPEPLLVLTPELRVRAANTAFYEHFQLDPKRTMDCRVFELGDGQWDIPELRKALLDVLPHDNAFSNFQVDTVFEGVGRRVMLLNARRLDNMNLILLGLRDITARHQADEALAASEERFRALVTATSDAMYRMNADWSEMRELCGGQFVADTETPTSAWLERYILREDQPRVLAAIGDAIRGKTIFELEHRVHRVDGTPGWAVSRAVPLLDANGNITEWFGVASDITDRKRAQLALEANARLSEDRRRQNAFLESLSHELRNPLAPIRYGLTILQRVPAGSDQARRALQVIDRQTTQLTNLVNDLLDVTRASRNKITLRRQRLDLVEVVRNVVDDNRALFDEARVRLDFTAPAAPVEVDADRTRLGQVIGNLLNNAAKFCEPGGQTRVLLTEGDGKVVVRVVDDGIGMSAETMDALFKPFMQADQGLERGKGGLGLGLAVSKLLAELHGGALSAHSQGLGKGTEMRMTLPVAEPEPAGPAEPPSAPKYTAEPRRVLLIEDSSDGTATLTEALQLDGHEVETAGSGPEGLEKARHFLPDVVLCDIGLPGMDGYEVARRLRGDKDLQGVFLVALTGYALPADIDRASEAGFNRHLAKPPSLEQIREILAEAPHD